MIFPDRLRLPLHFDSARLASDLDNLAREAWIAHFVGANYDGDCSVIPLRGKAGAMHPDMMIYADPFCRDFADTPFLDACPYMREVLEHFQCPLEAVRLMRLGPGSTIKEHTDFDLNIETGSVRIHIPVVTSPDVTFMLNRSRVVLDAGSAWYLRLSDPHSVVNHGSAARVHLVIYAVVNPWV